MSSSLQELIVKLEAAYYSGVRTIQHGGKRLTYNSTKEVGAALAAARAQAAGRPGRSFSSTTTTSGL